MTKIIVRIHWELCVHWKMNLCFSDNMPLTIGFMYPSGAAVTALGIWAIQKGHNLVLYCPGYPDPAIGRTVLTDLLVHGYEKLNQGED